MIDPKGAAGLLGVPPITLPHAPLTATLPGGLPMPDASSWQNNQASQPTQPSQPTGVQTQAQPTPQPTAAPFDPLQDLQQRIGQYGQMGGQQPTQGNPLAAQPASRREILAAQAPAFQALEVTGQELASAAQGAEDGRRRAMLLSMAEAHQLASKVLRKEDPKGSLHTTDVMAGYVVLLRRTDLWLYRHVLQALAAPGTQLVAPPSAVLARSVALWSLLSAKLNEQLEHLMLFIETPAPNGRVILDHSKDGTSAVLTPQQYALRRLNQSRLTQGRRQIGGELLELAQELAAQLHEERNQGRSAEPDIAPEDERIAPAGSEVTAAMLGEG